MRVGLSTTCVVRTHAPSYPHTHLSEPIDQISRDIFGLVLQHCSGHVIEEGRHVAFHHKRLVRFRNCTHHASSATRPCGAQCAQVAKVAKANPCRFRRREKGFDYRTGCPQLPRERPPHSTTSCLSVSNFYSLGVAVGFAFHSCALVPQQVTVNHQWGCTLQGAIINFICNNYMNV